MSDISRDDSFAEIGAVIKSATRTAKRIGLKVVPVSGNCDGTYQVEYKKADKVEARIGFKHEERK